MESAITPQDFGGWFGTEVVKTMMDKVTKKKSKPRGVQGGLRLVQDAKRFWDQYGRDPESFIPILKDIGLPGADLLALDPGIEYPSGTELAPLLSDAFDSSTRLAHELKDIIQASSFDADSKKAVLDTIRSYGTAMERRGALYVQFELRSVDQYVEYREAAKRAETRRRNSPRTKRLNLIVEWIKTNLPQVASYEELYEKRTEIAEWLKGQQIYVPEDNKSHQVYVPEDSKQRGDLKEAFSLWSRPPAN